MEKKDDERGQTRMDAALDAMRPFGFPYPLVRQKVKELLNVYGGDDGWVFVEEGAYSLLIETLLDNENANEEEHRVISFFIFLFLIFFSRVSV
ncbi:hypothetical protein FEM48_Zijuj02G0158200 [Ziziphus jujuba var. spinosa]|uniref:WIYLD domain-containing protein n=1 Tax=Ziziphus jujuba var. spinosa TaxID=714518 RepID=A0A978VWK2_ZIZJJ|nr:hypothetical protein FEM48_Zijuj02G0158200 [Ziziphus jujuba var. spinosa]